MQNAKDTFYENLRGRLATLNPERTVSIRGVTRPGLIVDENEAMASAPMPDIFHLRWASCATETQGCMALVTSSVEVTYTTAGSSVAGGLDRGRALAAMDAELLAAIRQFPQNAVKNNFAALASGGVALPMATRVWWGDPTFGVAEVQHDRITRTATVAVMSYQEAGEL